MWIEPKTNWYATDYINIEDYNRIKNDLAELREMAIRLYPEFSIVVNPDKTWGDYPYADEINQLEHNLESIRNNTFPFQTGQSQTYYDNQAYIDWQELNRLESACKIIHDNLQGQATGKLRLSIRLGGEMF